MPRQIILVRHGQTDYNQERRMQGWLDIPLNQTGHQQAQTTAQKLARRRIHALYSSDLMRAVQTATPIAAKLKLTLKTTAHLRERDMGIFAGWRWESERDERRDRLWSQFEKARDQELRDWAEHGGESVGAMIGRIASFLDQLHQLHRGQTVILVSHGGTINRILEHYRVKRSDEGYTTVHNASLTILTKVRSGYAILD